MSRRHAIALLLVALAGGVSLSVQAKDDQEQARQAVERGEIRSLDEILAAARKAVPGDVVALELKRKDERWLYEIKILTAEGKRREVKVDASSLAILGQEDDDDD
ncbi:PepSY domain-containing protein [Methylobacterium haplocladii]|uniref:PepSY domain-containing protein n=1 Tax=Methylobacterium haplocladii TaxID=1176176 RepID=A0A512IPS8_9HYPH|nr:PepSY domain-containing protein [Methylobacterium haplocladii]GEO99713.1 hypothetical protein MHA02_21010 [Methylobacterium haplocladii]GJD84655.1 hypothetical protein HPGCJGGD_2535 [Methylobacterium haplocladii]GLS58662.1 hypothetical protein GCM10007887_13260 [Methylobacterium haplocladii]